MNPCTKVTDRFVKLPYFCPISSLWVPIESYAYINCYFTVFAYFCPFYKTKIRKGGWGE